MTNYATGNYFERHKIWKPAMDKFKNKKKNK